MIEEILTGIGAALLLIWPVWATALVILAIWFIIVTMVATRAIKEYEGAPWAKH